VPFFLIWMVFAQILCAPAITEPVSRVMSIR